MKVKCEVSMDLESGDYELRFWNVSNPGQDIEYNEVKHMLEQIFASADKKVNSGENSTTLIN